MLTFSRPEELIPKTKSSGYLNFWCIDILLCCAFDHGHVEEGSARQGAGDRGQDRERARGDYHLRQGGRGGGRHQHLVRDAG